MFLKLWWTNFQHEIREIPEKNKSFFFCVCAAFGTGRDRHGRYFGWIRLLRKTMPFWGRILGKIMYIGKFWVLFFREINTVILSSKRVLLKEFPFKDTISIWHLQTTNTCFKIRVYNWINFTILCFVMSYKHCYQVPRFIFRICVCVGNFFFFLRPLIQNNRQDYYLQHTLLFHKWLIGRLFQKYLN